MSEKLNVSEILQRRADEQQSAGRVELRKILSKQKLNEKDVLRLAEICEADPELKSQKWAGLFVAVVSTVAELAVSESDLEAADHDRLVSADDHQDFVVEREEEIKKLDIKLEQLRVTAAEAAHKHYELEQRANQVESLKRRFAPLFGDADFCDTFANLHLLPMKVRQAIGAAGDLPMTLGVKSREREPLRSGETTVPSHKPFEYTVEAT
jgi:hypothetical protein